MGRPLYETDNDRTAEAAAKKTLSEAWGVTIHKLPMRYKIDWAVEQNGKLTTIIEYKKRDIAHDQYDKIILSLDKVVAGLELGQWLQVPFMFMVEFTDGLMYCTIDCIERNSVEWAGRTVKTRDWQDVEPCYMVDSSRFRKVEKK